ncbi:YbaK/EbsC family protein [Bifidobacterium sp.]|jgi:hypothetical protein|uniref:YbaK/EbsC family protein n=1 Tax=Bifidobacterium sp. TaxID=41200 RepID=UPI0025C6D820|nr:YbaK/EbsC family protein [Bifidobacterium sp.]MCI1635494.1 hypothetical protein [Bifidobacterium sp.]
MSVSSKAVEDLLSSLNLAYRIQQHAPITSIQEAMESGVLIDLGITVNSTVKNLLLSSSDGNCYLLVAPGMGRVDLKDVAKQIASKRLSFASLNTFGTVFGESKGQVTLFDLLDSNERVRKVQLVLDSRVSKIVGNTAFHIGSNHVSALVKAEDVPTIAKAIQPSYLTYSKD